MLYCHTVTEIMFTHLADSPHTLCFIQFKILTCMYESKHFFFAFLKSYAQCCPLIPVLLLAPNVLLHQVK